ncbi:uncharacterized protein LOC143152671 [Ptiloglossa arizonensis]|uniref:uncharacterized protein LOC143152671 n=1 Tax=Ptiloglossa arizonensis TaxID=3350558 RepID=UPI003F9EEE2E
MHRVKFRRDKWVPSVHVPGFFTGVYFLAAKRALAATREVFGRWLFPIVRTKKKSKVLHGGGCSSLTSRLTHRYRVSSRATHGNLEGRHQNRRVKVTVYFPHFPAEKARGKPSWKSTSSTY